MPLSRRELLKSVATSTVLAGAPSGIFATQSHAASPVAGSSRYQWQPRALPRRPNIALVVLDDVGFSDLSCYGSEISTSCIDALARDGVRFNNFHVTALCAPTRACLMTGQNAHRVGVGNIAEWGRPLPGYRGWASP